MSGSAKLDFRGFPYPVIDPTFTMYLSRMATLDHSKVKYCVWHHTGGRDHDATAASSNKYHIEVQGWAGIGYHGQIRWNGNLELGRPIHKRGVHSSKVNDISLGFCMSGNFEIGDIMTRPDQYKSGVALAKVVNKAFPGIQHVRHKDVGVTACNGALFPWEQFLKDIYTEDDMAKYHIVQQGDGLYKIASANNLTREEITAFNPHIPNPNNIYFEHEGDIVWLSQPNETEIDYGKFRRGYILCRMATSSVQEELAQEKTARIIAENQVADRNARLDRILIDAKY